MEEKKSPIEALFDENDTSTITLYNEKNEPVEFNQIAVIPLEDKVYAILQPVVMTEGADEDEALVFELEEVADEEVVINLVKDDATIDAVFNEYYKLIKEHENDETNDEE